MIFYQIEGEDELEGVTINDPVEMDEEDEDENKKGEEEKEEEEPSSGKHF